MSKAILEFNLPEDREEFEMASKGPDYYNALFDIDNHCRNSLKHGHAYKTPDEVLEDIRKMILDHVEI